MAILETKNLSKAFGALAAVDDVSLAIEAGTLHSIIGPNGAGKTTLFNLLTGTYRPSSGRILFDGRDITGTPAHRVAHLGLARSFQRTNVFPAFSLLDNVWLAAFACGESWKGLLWRRADRLSVMHFGRLIAGGTPAEIQGNREVRRAYLGGVAA